MERERPLVVVAKTARIPFDCLVVHRDLEQQLAKDLRAAVLNLPKSDDDADRRTRQELEASWGLDGFVAPMHAAYDEVETALGEPA